MSIQNPETECYASYIVQDKTLLQRFRCCICKQVPRRLVLDADQSFYGEACFVSAIRSGRFGEAGVPKLAREELIVAAQNELNDAIVVCDKHIGCDWRGRLADYVQHTILMVESGSFSIQPVEKDFLWIIKSTALNPMQLETSKEATPEEIQNKINSIRVHLRELVSPLLQSHVETMLDRLVALTEQKLNLIIIGRDQPEDLVFHLSTLSLTNSPLFLPDDKNRLNIEMRESDRQANPNSISAVSLKARFNDPKRIESLSSDNRGKIHIADNKRPDSLNSDQQIVSRYRAITSQYLTCWSEKNIFSAQFLSRFIRVYQTKLVADKSIVWRVKFMRQPLENFGIDKKLIFVDLHNALFLGLFLKQEGIINGFETSASKIGDSIISLCLRSGKIDSDESKVSYKRVVKTNFPLNKVLISFNSQTRVLSIFEMHADSLRALCRAKVFESVSLNHIHFYYDKFTKFNDFEVNFFEEEFENSSEVNVEMEEYQGFFTRLTDKSIVRTNDQGIHCILLDKPLLPFKNYKFRFENHKNNCNFAAVGIMKKGKLEANHYLLDFKAGYQENCGLFIINNQGEFMSDFKFYAKSSAQIIPNPFFCHNDVISVILDQSPQSISFLNIGTNAGKSFYHPFHPEEIAEYFVGVAIGSGSASFCLIGS